MITVEEEWTLAEGIEPDAMMHEIEDVIGPLAHDHSGWAGHAMFLQPLEDSPNRLVLIYPWNSLKEHEDMIEKEQSYLPDFYKRLCSGPRSIRYYRELPHPEHDHDHGHNHDH